MFNSYILQNITDKIFENLDFLETFECINCNKITNEGIEKLLKKCCLLKYIKIIDCNKITKKIFNILTETILNRGKKNILYAQILNNKISSLDSKKINNWIITFTTML